MKNDLRSAYSPIAEENAVAEEIAEQSANQNETFNGNELIATATPSANTTQSVECTVQIVPWVTTTADPESDNVASVRRDDIVGVRMTVENHQYTRVLNAQRINRNLMNIGSFAAIVEVYKTKGVAKDGKDYRFGVASVTPVISKLTTNQILLMGGNVLKV
jgi:hypothetical protein